MRTDFFFAGTLVINLLSSGIKYLFYSDVIYEVDPSFLLLPFSCHAK